MLIVLFSSGWELLSATGTIVIVFTANTVVVASAESITSFEAVSVPVAVVAVDSVTFVPCTPEVVIDEPAALLVLF